MVRESSYVLTVDPGLEGTGLALWDFAPMEDQGFEVTIDNIIKPVAITTIRPDKGLETWHAKLSSIVIKTHGWLANTLPWHEFGAAYIEWPRLFTSSAQNRAATAGGAIFKLAGVAGAIGSICVKNFDALFLPVPVNDWKGNLPDKVVSRKVRHIWPNIPRTSIHCRCAIGIGFWLLGVFDDA